MYALTVRQLLIHKRPGYYIPPLLTNQKQQRPFSQSVITLLQPWVLLAPISDQRHEWQPRRLVDLEVVSIVGVVVVLQYEMSEILAVACFSAQNLAFE